MLLIKYTLLIILSVIAMNNVEAKKLYRYQDSQGQWHYSDVPRKTSAHRYETLQIKVDTASNNDFIRVENKGTEAEPRYYAYNDAWMPIEIKIMASALDNIKTTPTLPLRRVIPPRSKVALFQAKTINNKLPAQIKYTYKTTYGDPSSKHSPHAVYQLPFKKKKKFRVSQGFAGGTSHSGPQNAYAVDIAMHEGAQVMASRAGTVVDIKQDFFENGMTAAMRKQANVIRILHDDGTMSAYAHLKADRVFVYEGQHINAGDLIAESGNTGFSSGPHLHFVVQKNTGMRLKAIPFKFTLSNHRIVVPKTGDTLQ